MKHPRQLLNFFILANKPIGISSFNFIYKFKKQFHTNKIGHIGTLDPAASGLLILAANEATKFINFLKTDSKTYEFKILFGKQTDSFDLDGKIIAENDILPEKDNLIEIIKNFYGEIIQVPNKFSAIKINGKRAYELARENIDFEMKERCVRIDKLEILEIDELNNCVKEVFLRLQCSQGFYVRSLANDICKKLNVLGVVSHLERIQDSFFNLAQLDNAEKIVELSILKEFYENVCLNDDEIKKLKNGVRINKNICDGIFAAVSLNGMFVGMLKINGAVIFPLRMIKDEI